MRALDVALVEEPEGREAGGPRVLGHITDTEIVAQIQEHIAAARRRELSRLEPPVRPVRDPQDPEPAQESELPEEEASGE